MYGAVYTARAGSASGFIFFDESEGSNPSSARGMLAHSCDGVYAVARKESLQIDWWTRFIFGRGSYMDFDGEQIAWQEREARCRLREGLCTIPPPARIAAGRGMRVAVIWRVACWVAVDRRRESCTVSSFPFRAGPCVFAGDGDAPSPSRSRQPSSPETPDYPHRLGAAETR